MSRILPILFNTDMVRAILDGRKTVTRRVIKKNWGDSCCNCKCIHNEFIYDNLAETVYCARCGEPLWINSFADRGYKPPCRTGDILYVRETWAKHPKMKKYYYRANSECNGHSTEWGCPEAYDRTENCNLCEWLDGYIKWRPSIHMPKEAARIWLKVTDIRVERLQDIGPQEAYKEGARCSCMSPTPDCAGNKDAFIKIWDSTVKKPDLDRYGWDADPWVWVIEFERCEEPADAGESEE